MSRPKDRPLLNRSVAFRLTDADHAAFLAKVKASGRKPSDFFRDCVLTNRTQIIARTPPSKDKKRLLFLYSKASNNLNQLAHRAHKDFHAGVMGERTYQAVCHQLETVQGQLAHGIDEVE